MLFVKPPVEAYRDPSLEGMCYLESHQARTYAEYNYLNGGLAANVKLAHFEKCLELTRAWFGSAKVIDFGCADGVFLASLAHHFEQVVGVDIRPDFIQVCRAVVANLKLANVELHCNREMSFEALRGSLSPGPYRLAFVLEVLEHVGEPGGDVGAARIDLLKEIAGLLAEDGRIVVSVPKMIGLPFLVQRLALAVLRLKREPISLGELLRASLLGDTVALERRWNRDHLGFNHRRLEEQLRQEFQIVRRTGTFFQAIYVLAPKSR